MWAYKWSRVLVAVREVRGSNPGTEFQIFKIYSFQASNGRDSIHLGTEDVRKKANELNTSYPLPYGIKKVIRLPKSIEESKNGDTQGQCHVQFYTINE